MHGDAAFAGQGIVAETFGCPHLKGYRTGGTIHFIINNQIGFTTSPQFARSSPYPTDVAKMASGADLPRQRRRSRSGDLRVRKLAVEYRQTFGRDVVIDMWCYRRFGHNEGDEPKFTQPLMYDEDRQAPQGQREIYSAKLIREGVIEEGFADGLIAEFTDHLEEGEFAAAKSYKANQADWLGRPLGGHEQAGGPTMTARRNVETASRRTCSRRSARTLTTVPDDFNDPPQAGPRAQGQGADMFESGEGIDWATARRWPSARSCRGHAGAPVGPGRGAAPSRQRHAVLVDQKDEHKYIPLNHRRAAQASSRSMTARCPKAGVLGFEYGFALADPDAGDVGSAVRRFRQRRADHHRPVHRRGEVKWLRANGLVMLLPHGYEGPGPRAHSRPGSSASCSSARGQHPGLQHHHAGELLPRAAPPDAARLPQAAGDHDAQEPAAPSAGQV